MTVSPGLVLALTGLHAEGDVVRSLTGAHAPARISRRVTDVVGLLAACGAGLADGALVAARFPGLDAGVLQRLRDAGVMCWGIVDPEDDDGHQLLRDRGLPVAVVGGDVASAMRALIEERAGTPNSPGATAGSLIVVTGPAGAPGRSTVALNVAAECPEALLVDADPSAPSLAFQLDLDPAATGILAASRAAQLGVLTPPALLAASQAAGDGLHVVTGVAAPARVGELDGVRGSALWQAATGTGLPVIVDAGAFPSPQAPALLAGALAAAGVVVVVADPSALGIRRLVSGYADLASQTSAPIILVWNRLVAGRSATLGRRPLERLRPVHEALGAAAVTGLPWDPHAAAALDGHGGSLGTRAPKSVLRAAIRGLAGDLVRSPVLPSRGSTTEQGPSVYGKRGAL